MKQAVGKSSLKKAFCEGRWAREDLPGRECVWCAQGPGGRPVQEHRGCRGSLAEVRGQQKSGKALGRGKGF